MSEFTNYAIEAIAEVAQSISKRIIDTGDSDAGVEWIENKIRILSLELAGEVLSEYKRNQNG